MSQVSLSSIILGSINPDDPNFINYQRYLQEFRQQNPQKLVEDILLVIKTPEIPYQLLFISLVLTKHCFNDSRLPITKENLIPDSSFPIELILELFDISFACFTHSEVSIRNAAIELFSNISITQQKNISSIGIDQRLIQIIHDSPNIHEKLSSIQCIFDLFEYYSFNEEQMTIIIETIFSILFDPIQETSSIKLIIQLIGEKSTLIFQLINDQSKILLLIQRVIEYIEIPELAAVVYRFIESSISNIPEILSLIIQPLVEKSIIDLQTASPDVILSLIWMYTNIIIAYSTSIAELLAPLIPPLIIAMENVSTSEINEEDDCEPYLAAYSCLHTLCYYCNEITFPILLEYVTGYNQSENPNEREGAVKCLNINFKSTPMEKLNEIIVPSLELLSNFIVDPESRVRLEAIKTLKVILNRIEHSEPFYSFIPFLFQLSKDEEAISKASFNLLSLISQQSDFTNFDEFYQALFQLIPTLPFNLLHCSIECFQLKANAQISTLNANQAFEFLTGMLAQFTTQFQEDQSVCSIFEFRRLLHSLYMAFATINPHCDEQISSLGGTLYELISATIPDFFLSSSLLAIATLSYPIPQIVESQLDSFVPIVINAMQTYDDPSTLVPAVHIVPLLIEKFDLGDFYAALVENTLESLKSGQSSESKIAALESLSKIISLSGTKMLQYIPAVLNNIGFLVSHLDVCYDKYQRDTFVLISIIINIEKSLFQILPADPHQAIFDFCISTILIISKMPNILESAIQDVCDLINYLYQHFTARMLSQIQNFPEICELVKISLNRLKMSDEEMTQLLSMETQE